MTRFQPFDRSALAGEVALVTGAAGGIGTELAASFAKCGMRLVLADLRREPLERVAEGLDGTDVTVWTGDLASEPQVQQLFRQIVGQHGRVDVAVNAAGIMRVTPLAEITKSEWDRVVDANLGSAFLVCRECIEPMRRQQGGRIVNFASLAGQTGGILAGAHYSAAKAGVISLTRSVAKLGAADGIRCNALAPGGVETEMLALFTPEQQEHLKRGIPLGRFAGPDEIAELVLWLISPASAFITGQTLNVNGGAYFG
jgi:NAD(P)-dependent dehydrogenase (short-subunit alcohol dehydrogenase family)